MQKNTAEKLCHRLRSIIMKPFIFQNAELTIMDAHLVLYLVHDWTVPKHSHPWYEFIYIINGSFINNIDGKERVYTAGEAFLIPPGIEHGHRPNEQEFSIQFCIRFQLNKTSEETDFYDDIIHLFSKLQLINTDLKFEQLEERISNATSYRLSAELWSWLLELCEDKLNNENHSNTQPQAIVYQANLYIEKNYMDKINAEKIAQLLNVSYRTLARHYKNETGITINKKINDVRLTNAKALLLNTDENIHNIALQVGYSDEFYFSNLFKKENKLSPLAFRKKFKKEKKTTRLLNY